MSKKQAQKTWAEKWFNELVKEDHTIDLPKLKQVLHDYSKLVDQVKKVYKHLTDGEIKNLEAEAGDVIKATENYFEKLGAKIDKKGTGKGKDEKDSKDDKEDDPGDTKGK